MDYPRKVVSFHAKTISERIQNDNLSHIEFLGKRDLTASEMIPMLEPNNEKKRSIINQIESNNANTQNWYNALLSCTYLDITIEEATITKLATVFDESYDLESNFPNVIKFANYTNDEAEALRLSLKKNQIEHKQAIEMLKNNIKRRATIMDKVKNNNNNEIALTLQTSLHSCSTLNLSITLKMINKLGPTHQNA